MLLRRSFLKKKQKFGLKAAALQGYSGMWKEKEPRAKKELKNSEKNNFTFSGKFTFKKKEIVKIKVHCYFHKPPLVGCRYFYLLKVAAKCLFILPETHFQRPFEKILLDI